MIGIDTISNLGLAPEPSTSRNKDDLGQGEFLELMIAQFQNQDPFKPMENGQFLGQLAQFSTVSGIEELQGSFETLAASLFSDQALQASGLVGREVLSVADTGQLTAGETMRGAVEVPADTQSVTLRISDPNGRLIRRLELGAHPQGLARFEWDGVGDDGQVAAAGTYHVAAETFLGGVNESASTLIATRVESVVLDGPGNSVLVSLAGLGEVPLSQIRQIL